MSYKSSINTGLPNIPDPPDPEFFGEFTRVYNAIRNLTIAVDTYTGALPQDVANYSTTPPENSLLSQNGLRLYGLAVVAIAYGQTVNLYNDGSGQVKFQLSCALTVGFKPMHGWCSTSGGIAAGGSGEIRLGGLCSAIGGLTSGATFYLGNTPGTISPTAGQVSQKLGFALTTNSIFFQPELK